MPIARQGAPDAAREVSESDIEAVRQAVASVRFGTVQIIIQDGRIVQIDKTEKIRLA
jgi:hypothetical protein